MHACPVSHSASSTPTLGLAGWCSLRAAERMLWHPQVSEAAALHLMREFYQAAFLSGGMFFHPPHYHSLCSTLCSLSVMKRRSSVTRGILCQILQLFELTASQKPPEYCVLLLVLLISLCLPATPAPLLCVRGPALQKQNSSVVDFSLAAICTKLRAACMLLLRRDPQVADSHSYAACFFPGASEQCLCQVAGALQAAAGTSKMPSRCHLSWLHTR